MLSIVGVLPDSISFFSWSVSVGSFLIANCSDTVNGFQVPHHILVIIGVQALPSLFCGTITRLPFQSIPLYNGSGTNGIGCQSGVVIWFQFQSI